jgi:geranylgeranyl diphosphate synthase type II
MGKAVQKDAARGKLTYPGLIGIPESIRKAQDLIAAACRAIEPLGDQGSMLKALARYVLERDR